MCIRDSVIDVRDIKLEAKQTEPPARYSQGKLIQEMEKLGLGTKSCLLYTSRCV